MKLHNLAFIVFIFTFALAGTASAQDTFSDPSVNYSFSLPDAQWKMTAKPSATNANVEYVYVDRSDGHLEVRKIKVARDAVLTDVIRDEEQRLRFNRGFVAGREENFAGKLRGSVFNFEYVSSGRSMSGRYYFLRADDTTVYMLRFSGEKDSLRSIKHHTDSIARTFSVK